MFFCGTCALRIDERLATLGSAARLVPSLLSVSRTSDLQRTRSLRARRCDIL